jgi:asparagine synthase (glutamine-hydrolysing)
MCGIAGIVEHHASGTDLAAMVRRLFHRGPDEEGSVVLPEAALGMRRLAIVDVAGGHQPFANEDRSIQVVANGEIYNFETVKSELQARGHAFHTRSDIEVIAHAYEEYGEGFASRLHGMFAIALWDARTRTLIAARDRAGEKPLYYARTARGLLLASEVKALVTRDDVPRELDEVALDEFLTYEYVISPRTIFRHVRRVPAAHYLKFRDGDLSVHRYWDAADVPLREWRDADAIEAFRTTMARVVDAQMMSDVPLGVFLSGGIDSSAIVAFMRLAAQRRGVTVNSFSMGFDDGSYDELPYAREVARAFGTTHREGRVTPKVEELFDRLVLHFDEPFGDVSLFPTFLVSQLARQHVTVALAGDGGDELFGGYDAYEAERLAQRFARFVPGGALKALDGLVSLLPPSEQKKGALNKLKRFVAGVSRAPAEIAQYRWMTFAHPSDKAALYAPRLRDALADADVYRPVREALGRGGDDQLNRQLYADLRIYLADDILVKVDRMSMATSLETRAPFLDVEMMELAFSMPGRFKIRDGERKWVVKRALEGLVPPRILTRRKEGFSIPMKQWLRRELRPIMERLLSRERLERRGLFQPGYVSGCIAAHVAGRENHAHLLFCLMVFERWAEEFLGDGRPA